MKGMGVEPETIHAGAANLFKSPVFRETLSGVTGATIELYDTDGAVGAARGAGLGAGVYSSANEAFASLSRLVSVEPRNRDEYEEAYQKWYNMLNK